jgi:hypothetical protein
VLVARDARAPWRAPRSTRVASAKLHYASSVSGDPRIEHWRYLARVLAEPARFDDHADPRELWMQWEATVRPRVGEEYPQAIAAAVRELPSKVRSRSDWPAVHAAAVQLLTTLDR